MTAREESEDLGARPELFVVVATVEDATTLAVLAGVDEMVHPTLVATGSDPMEVDLALDDLDAPAGRVLIPDGPADGPAEETARLLPRLAEAIGGHGGAPPAAVVVRGGSSSALAATHAAVWAGVPVLALDAPPRSAAEAANRAAIVGLAAWQTSAGGIVYPARLDLLVHGHLESGRHRRVVCMRATGGPRRVDGPTTPFVRSTTN